MSVREWSLCVMKLIVDQILSYSWGIPYSQRCFILVFLAAHLKALVPSRVDLLLVPSSLPEILACASCCSVSNFINTLVNTHMHYIDIIDFICMCLCSQPVPWISTHACRHDGEVCEALSTQFIGTFPHM